MPLFQCMGKLYQLTQADLNRAPDSVLATAWNASSREAPVGLEAWPEPDLDVFEVKYLATKFTQGPASHLTK